jgi:hypothetical protein
MTRLGQRQLAREGGEGRCAVAAAQSGAQRGAERET